MRTQLDLVQFETQALFPIIQTSSINAAENWKGINCTFLQLSVCSSPVSSNYIVINLSSCGDCLSLPRYNFHVCVGNYFLSWGSCRTLLACSPYQESVLCCQIFDVKQCSFICLSYFGVIRDRRINVSFNLLC